MQYIPGRSKLIADFNRNRDLEPENGGVKKNNTEPIYEVTTWQSENELIKRIIGSVVQFPISLEYDLFPGRRPIFGDDPDTPGEYLPGGYNSNSFIRGLIDAYPELNLPGFSGKSVLPGWDIPVPAKHY